MKNLAALVGLASMALGVTGCQTKSEIAQHFDGVRYKRVPSASAVELRKLSLANFDPKAHRKEMAKQGYSMVGKALFTGIHESVDEVKGFAASVGADLVEGVAYPVGTVTKTHMGIGSYTPQRTITSFGSSSVYGTDSTTTHIPSEITYVPQSYQVPVSQQVYLFWLSPSGVLRNWMDINRNSASAAGKQLTTEDIKGTAALFAQANNVRLPKSLEPKNSIQKLDAQTLEKIRESQVEAAFQK